MSRALPGVAASIAWLLASGCVDFGEAPWPDPPDTPDGRAAEPVTLDEPEPPEPDCPRPEGPVTIDVALFLNRITPHVVALCVGDTVRWTNKDQVNHTVVSGDPGASDDHFSSPLLGLGDAWERRFDTAATHRYYCSTHKKKMRDARVLVSPETQSCEQPGGC